MAASGHAVSAHARRRRTRGDKARVLGAWYASHTRSWPCAQTAPRAFVARSRMVSKAWSKQQSTGRLGHRAVQAPGVACQPSVGTVCGASSSSKPVASWAKGPEACFTSGGDADGATEAPSIPSRPAVVARETRGPVHQRCLSSATRSLGKGSAVCTGVPTILKRPKPWGNRYHYRASRPTTSAIAHQGTGNRIRTTAFSTASTRPLLEGLTNAGATVKTSVVSLRRSRRQRRGCLYEGSVTPSRAWPHGQAAGNRSGESSESSWSRA